ncbi:MAG TPA: PAS domain-containing protein [Gemmatales bacterium]|nr:PAS domain-containing protein [Gemmatales bacterium]
MDAALNFDLESLSAALRAENARLAHEGQQLRAALEGSETRLKLVSQAIISVVIDWDLTTNQFTRVNSPLEMMGYGFDETATSLEGMREGIHPDDLSRFDSALSKWLQGTETDFHLEMRCRHKDGTYRHLRTQAIVVREPGSNRPLRVIGSYADVTAEREALAALRVSDERNRLATEAMQGIVFDWNFATRTIYYSSGTLRLLGYAPEEVAPKPGWWRNRIHPHDQETVLHDLKKFLRADDTHGNFYFRIRHREGHYLYVHSNFLAIRNAAGQAKRIVGCIVDLTPRIQAEQAQRAAERNFHRLFHDIPQGLVVLDPQDRVIECNQAFAELLGRPLDEIMGKPLQEFALASEWNELLSLNDETYVEEADYAWQKEITRRDGSRFPIRLQGKLIPYQQFDQRCRFGILEDLTEHKQAEQERRRLELHLQETQRLESLGVLAGGIAHDFNNLLTVILGNLSLIKQELPAKSLHHQSLEQSEQASRQAAELCRQMLAYAGRGKLENKPFDLSELVESSRALLSTAATRQHHLHFHLSSGLPSMAGDPSQIRQIVMNLVQNAAEAIPRSDGTIDVLTGVAPLDEAALRQCLFANQHQPGQYLWLEVRDSGHGMDEVTRKRIFEPFFTTKFTGRGLGLAAVAGIVRTHRGMIQCHSVPLTGTFFRIYFPIDATAPRPVATTSQDSVNRPAPSSNQGTILVVDDEPSVRTVLARLLGKRGFAVIEAENGNEALEMVARHAGALRLIILDLTMPQRDGLSTLREIRKQKIRTPVVLISGYYSNELIPQLEQLQAKYISKPFTAQNLLEVIDPILAG